MSKSIETTSGLGLSGTLFVVFLVLKLTGNIDWSWWWVTAPLWIPLALLLGFGVIVLAVAGVVAVIGAIKDE